VLHEVGKPEALMLAYRHQFHAGNFADVFKHVLLTRALLAMARKPTPFLYLDTHAGIGRYDLEHAWSRKNAEHRDGIGRVWGERPIPPLVQPYLQAVRAENPSGRLRFYPGSPLLARRFLRAGDRMVLAELNRDDHAALARLFAPERDVAVRRMDGYLALKAYLPPRERRGLILIDSSFDRQREFKRLAEGLALAHRRFATGVYALWYPLMELGAMRAFERHIAQLGIRKILQLELSVVPDAGATPLRGCGMLVVNPPFGLAQEARGALDWLAPRLAHGPRNAPSESVQVQWLVPDQAG
jgi:23S rRNA (adenine2030-N6)-methyltransferase